MGIIDEIKQLGARLAHEKDVLTEKVSDLVGQLADSEANETFAIMRRVDPIVSAGPTTIVALNEDVKEVLGDPARFTAHLYGPKMEAITGPFILGVDDTPLYHHDHAAMDRAVTREDLPRLGDSMYDAASELVAARRDAGTIDVVSQLADPALDRVIAEYFGTPGPDTATQLRWARNVFQELFINVGNLPTVRERAHADAAEWRPHLDGLVEDRKAQLQAGEDVPDDVLTRLLRYQDEGEPNFHDVAIRHNILGNITGWIPTISNAFARIVEELLRPRRTSSRPRRRRRGRATATSSAAYCWEASRFRPQNFALLRYVPEDTVIARAPTARRRSRPARRSSPRRCRRCTTRRRSTSPRSFASTGPSSDYMLFGYGMHTCYGQHIVRAQMPALATALLEGPRIRRARGHSGRLRFEGPFPSGLTVRFDADG